MNYIEVTTTGIVTQVKTYSTTLTVEEARKAINDGEEVQTIGEEISCDPIDEEVLHAKAKYLNNNTPEEDVSLFCDDYNRRAAAEKADKLLEALKNLLKRTADELFICEQKRTAGELWTCEQETIDAMKQAKELINQIEA